MVPACGIRLGAQSTSQESNSTASPATSTDSHAVSPELDKLLRDGWGLYSNHRDGEAKASLEKALALAGEEKNDWGAAEAHRIFGLIALHAANYPVAQSEFDQALKLFESAKSFDRVARVHQHLGAVASYMGKPAEAGALYRQALSEFEALQDLTSQATVLQNLSMLDALPAVERYGYLERGLALANEVGNKGLAGRFLHTLGDHLFTQGDYAGAIEKLKEAAAALDAAGDRSALASVWTSLGRLYRAHAAYDDAIASYQKGLSIQQEIGDKIGVIQSLNAMAISYDSWGRAKEATENYERALALARETGSPMVIAFMTGNLGGHAVDNGDYKRGIELLEESLRLDPLSPYKANRYLQLSQAYRGTQQYEQALESANEAVKLSREAVGPGILYLALQERAHVYQALERYSEALTDTQDAIQVVEQIRSKLVPADYLKQGYAGGKQDLFEEAIQIHEKLGQHREAMVVAEEARARAFLDLLASRGLEQRTALSTPSTAANDTPGSLPSSKPAASAAKKDERIEVTTRGSNPLRISEPSGALALSSSSSAAPPTFEELVATAKRLDSTLLSYWVAEDATYIWVLRPDGTVRGERVAVTSEHLSKLIHAASYGEGPRTESTASTAPARRATDTPAASTISRGSQTLRLRGGGELIIGGNKSESWCELYKLLILPVKDSLPPDGSHLTIVPQGPLFRLSFAALKNTQGHYLVESFALNYAPSLGVLRLTGQRKQQLGEREPSYLLVADPTIAPELTKDAALPSLPGARKEARDLVRLLPHGETTLLMGSDATKRAVRDGATGKTVLHLATHAIVRDDEPLDSFLVVSASDNSSPGSDRLTVQEIYGMDLQTDLVVLSACRTALGKVSGDGMAGLTRAFFYGGAPSVMATLWDVADEPTSSLIFDFYSSLLKGHDKSRALRAAQLKLIRRLRLGRVKANTVLGPVTLPEDPVFWAGFVLQGEP
jgi:CHAT domain-containing protein/tetratricopeptide (TPR) repeat protein